MMYNASFSKKIVSYTSALIEIKARSELSCPVAMDRLRNPYILPCGHTVSYEVVAIMQPRICPLDRKPFKIEDCKPNINFELFLDKIPFNDIKFLDHGISLKSGSNKRLAMEFQKIASTLSSERNRSVKLHKSRRCIEILSQIITSHEDIGCQHNLILQRAKLYYNCENYEKSLCDFDKLLNETLDQDLFQEVFDHKLTIISQTSPMKLLEVVDAILEDSRFRQFDQPFQHKVLNYLYNALDGMVPSKYNYMMNRCRFGVHQMVKQCYDTNNREVAVPAEDAVVSSSKLKKFFLKINDELFSSELN